MGKTVKAALVPIEGEPEIQGRERGRPPKYHWDEMQLGKWHAITQVNGSPSQRAVYMSALRWTKEPGRNVRVTVKCGSYGQVLVRFEPDNN